MTGTNEQSLQGVDETDPDLTSFKNWPFAVDRLQQEPIPAVIQEHALGHLCRALNIGRVTAFVGSGASLAYGRISWSDLVESLKQWALNEADQDPASLTDGRMIRLREILTNSPRAKTAAQFTAQFQLAEGLAAMLSKHNKMTGLKRFQIALSRRVYDATGMLARMLEGLPDELASTTEGELNAKETAIRRLLESRHEYKEAKESAEGAWEVVKCFTGHRCSTIALRTACER